MLINIMIVSEIRKELTSPQSRGDPGIMSVAVRFGATPNADDLHEFIRTRKGTAGHTVLLCWYRYGIIRLWQDRGR